MADAGLTYGPWRVVRPLGSGGMALAGAVPLGYGLALHFGDVMYGNIGATGRLDFTVIGPAVNLAARLEGISARLGVPVVLSEAFAARCGGAAPAGRHVLKGLADPVEVFLPA